MQRPYLDFETGVEVNVRSEGDAFKDGKSLSEVVNTFTISFSYFFSTIFSMRGDVLSETSFVNWTGVESVSAASLATFNLVWTILCCFEGWLVTWNE